MTATIKVPNANPREVEKLLAALPPDHAGGVSLDLSALEFIGTVHQAILPSWLFARAGAVAELTLPENEAAQGFAQTSGLTQALRGGSEVREWESGLPLRVIRDQVEASDAAEELGKLVARKCDAAQTGDLIELYGEILDNALRHGEADPYAVVAAQHFPKRDQLEITIADAGIGIPESFRSQSGGEGRGIVAARRSALLFATEAEATSKPDRHTGLGLFLTSEAVRMNGGYLRIVSFGEELLIDDGELTIRPAAAPWRGTLILMTLRTDRSLHWEEANDLLGGVPSGRYGCCVLHLRLYGSALVTRERGRAVRQDLAVLGRRGPVAVDAAGVEALSPSFLDEAFVRGPLDESEAPVSIVTGIRGLNEAASKKLDRLRRQRKLQ